MSDDATREYERALKDLNACFQEGPSTGVLLVLNNETGRLNLHTLNHDFTRVFGLLVSALNIVHEKQTASKVSFNFNVH